MLTIAHPDPSGNINISKQGQRDNLRRILTMIGFEFMLEGGGDAAEEIRRTLDPNGTNLVKVGDFATFLE